MSNISELTRAGIVVAAPSIPSQNHDATPRLANWNVYFLAKLALYWQGLIGLHALENLALALLLLMPLQHRWAAWLRTLLALPAAAALLYYDSYLPPFERLLAQSSLVASFSPAYLAELAGRFVSWPAVAMLLVVVAGYRIAALRLRVGAVVVAALTFLVIVDPARLGTRATQPVAQASPGAAAPAVHAAREGKLDLDAVLRDRFADEAKRRVAFSPPGAAAPPFDVIFLHVCSLAWDDLRATGLDKHPLLQGMDILLTNFNSGASYSGPAVIRMLRAPCGASPHADLYSPPADGDCFLLPALKRAGFQTSVVLNHDGHFDDFLTHVRAQGIQAGPLPLKGVAAPLRAFDDSRIHDDGAVLARWLEARRKSAAPRAAVYYNTVSLHDGNRLVSDPATKSSETYKVRLAKLLDDVNGFVTQLAASGRRAIVVVVPEHGAAWRGDAAQIAGLREIPTPAITLVPVGIRVIGPDARRTGDALQVPESTSFLALSHVVSRMLAQPPFGADGFRPADYAAGMPLTDFVSEGENATLLGRGAGYVIRQDQDAWKEFR